MTQASTPHQPDAEQNGNPCETPFEEMYRLARLHPAHTMLQVIDMIDRDRWDIEHPSPDQRAVYRRVNAVVALDRMRQSIDHRQSQFPMDAPPRSWQWLPSGEHLCLANVLDDKVIAKLASCCDALLPVRGTKPIRLSGHAGILDDAQIAAIAQAVLQALPNPGGIPRQPAVLRKRTMLRRTFPPSQLPSTFGNANNQFWHQDSNAQFDDSAMLTLWIPLQDGAGVTCPGLQVIDAPVSHFSILAGDSSRDIYPLLVSMFPKAEIVTAKAAAGDCVTINGLTFHQTFTLPTMTKHRDALLIRIIDRAAAHLFGIADPQKDLVALD